MLTFPKAARLRNAAEFKTTLDRGAKAVNRHVIVYGVPRSETIKGLRPVRLGLIVSKKVGNSVERNRVKRALREGFRHLQDDAALRGAADTLDIVVIARNEATRASCLEIMGSLRHGIGRLAKQRRDAQPVQSPA